MAGPSGGQNQQNNQNDNSLDFIWMIVLIVAAIGLSWYFGKNYITAFIYQVRFYEIAAITFVVNLWNQFTHLVPFLPAIDLSKLNSWAALIQQKAVGTSFQALQDMSYDVGSYLRYPTIIVLAALAFFVYSKNVTMKFKTVFNMKRLREQENKNWPQITPILKHNLIKEDIDKGPWAMSMTPMQFCKRFDLIQEEVDDDGKKKAILKNNAAGNYFVLQLGSLWQSAKSLPIHARALFAIFAACANQDRKAADVLLDQIAYSAADNGKLNFAGTDELLAKYIDSKVVTRAVQKHAYVLTVMASMLELARTNGVLASAEFLWLKPIDRRLWYVLNSVGRQTAVPEVAGPFAHWLAEKKLSRALQVPMIDEAVRSLEVALTEILYEGEEE